MGERVPQHVQNIVIKDFCQKRNFNFLLSVSEYSMPNSFYILKDLLNNLTGLYDPPSILDNLDLKFAPLPPLDLLVL